SVSVVGGPFNIESVTNFALAGFSSTNVVVSFNPTNAGSFTNFIVFKASNGGNRVTRVSGTGLTAAQLAVVPSSIDFGLVDVTAGTNALASLLVTNLGGASITNGVASVEPGPFSIVSGTPFNLSGFSSTNLV